MNNKQEGKKFVVELTEQQIAILKAALNYYRLIDDFGYITWSLYGSVGGSGDAEYQFKALDISKILNEHSSIVPDYGFWINIKYINLLLTREYKKEKRKWNNPKSIYRKRMREL